MRAVLLFPILLWCVPMHGQTSVDSTALAKADTLFARGKYKDALKAYEKLCAREHPAIGALEGKANALFATGANDEAFLFLTDRITFARSNADSTVLRELLLHRGSSYQRFHRRRQAIADATLVLDLHPDSMQRDRALFQRSACRKQERELGLAVADLETLLRIDTNNAHAHNNLAISLFELGREQEAMAHLQRYLDLEPDDFSAIMNMGYYAGRQGRYEEALDWYRRAAVIDPDDNKLLNNRGYARFKSGDPEGAIDDIEASIRIDASNAYAYRNLALVFFGVGRHDDACEACEKALELGFTREWGDEVKRLYDEKCR